MSKTITDIRGSTESGGELTIYFSDGSGIIKSFGTGGFSNKLFLKMNLEGILKYIFCDNEEQYRIIDVHERDQDLRNHLEPSVNSRSQKDVGKVKRLLDDSYGGGRGTPSSPVSYTDVLEQQYLGQFEPEFDTKKIILYLPDKGIGLKYGTYGSVYHYFRAFNNKDKFHMDYLKQFYKIFDIVENLLSEILDLLKGNNEGIFKVFLERFKRLFPGLIYGSTMGVDKVVYQIGDRGVVKQFFRCYDNIIEIFERAIVESKRKVLAKGPVAAPAVAIAAPSLDDLQPSGSAEAISIARHREEALRRGAQKSDKGGGAFAPVALAQERPVAAVAIAAPSLDDLQPSGSAEAISIARHREEALRRGAQKSDKGGGAFAPVALAQERPVAGSSEPREVAGVISSDDEETQFEPAESQRSRTLTQRVRPSEMEQLRQDFEGIRLEDDVPSTVPLIPLGDGRYGQIPGLSPIQPPVTQSPFMSPYGQGIAGGNPVSPDFHRTGEMRLRSGERYVGNQDSPETGHKKQRKEDPGGAALKYTKNKNKNRKRRTTRRKKRTTRRKKRTTRRRKRTTRRRKRTRRRSINKIEQVGGIDPLCLSCVAGPSLLSMMGYGAAVGGGAVAGKKIYSKYKSNKSSSSIKRVGDKIDVKRSEEYEINEDGKKEKLNIKQKNNVLDVNGKKKKYNSIRKASEMYEKKIKSCLKKGFKKCIQ